MTTETDILNDCLATLGESPIDVNDDHPHKARIMRLIAKSRTSILARGWWFNTRQWQTVLNTPNSLGANALAIHTGTRSSTDLAKQPTLPWLYLIAGVIVDSRTNSSLLTDDVLIDVVYDEPSIANLPTVIADAVGALAVLRFQSDYDADTNRREELRLEHRQAMALAVAEDVRVRKVNLLNSNSRLARIKRVSRRMG